MICEFSEIEVGGTCMFGGVKIMKTSNVSTKGKLLPECESNCVILHNGHKAVVSERAFVYGIESK